MDSFTLLTTNIFSPSMILFLAIFLFLILGFFILVAVIIRLSAQMKYITYPVYDQVIKEAQSKATKIIGDATEQSQSIRTSAQENVEKILSDRKEEDEKFREEYVKHFEEVIAHGTDTLKKQSDELLQLSKEMVNKFEEHVLVADTLIHKESDTLSNILLGESDKLKKTFEEMGVHVTEEQKMLVEETKRSVSENIEKEVSMAREAVNTYKKERLSALDSEIVVLVEETARIALNKSLSLKEHSDQIISALKDAEKEGVFA